MTYCLEHNVRKKQNLYKFYSDKIMISNIFNSSFIESIDAELTDIEEQQFIFKEWMGAF